MPANTSSVLDSIKKTLGIGPDDDSFDLDVVMHINTAFSTLRQLGVGPVTGFAIEDNTSTWDQFSEDMVILAAVKSYVYAKVRVLFDPPSTSFALDALKNNISELEWRLNVDGETLNPPSPPDGVDTGGPSVYWWDLTGQSDFPSGAEVGDLGIDMSTGDVWRDAS